MDELSKQAGVEEALDKLVEGLRSDVKEIRHFMKLWEPQMASNINARTKMNQLGFAVYISAVAAGRAIVSLSHMTPTRDWKPVLDEIEDYYELLSSWDLTVHFGWREENA